MQKINSEPHWVIIFVHYKIFRKSAITAQIFDPFVLREASIERICELADELVHLGYDK